MNISRLPVSTDDLEVIQAIGTKACSVWVERVLAYASCDSHARDRERMPLQADIRLRTRETPSQIGLTSRQRRDYLRGAVAGASEVTGREVLLVNDIYDQRHEGRVRVSVRARRGREGVGAYGSGHVGTRI